MDLDSAQTIDGYCWYVVPERGGVPDVQPFAKVPSSGADAGLELVQAPSGVEDYWALGNKTVGIHNRPADRAYLVVTTESQPPTVSPGWSVEPAQIDDDFQIDQGGSRWVHMIRVKRRVETELGPVAECVFEVMKG